jgi:hypothetical protein
MQRPFLTLLCFLTIFCTCALAQKEPGEKETPISSTITSATVFLEGAQVNRTATASIPAGRATLVFTGLTTDLDPKSIQVSAKSNGFIILSVSRRLNFNKPPTTDLEGDKLYGQIDALDHRKDLLTTRFKIARAEEEILDANRKVAGTTTGLDAEQLRQTVAFQRERITAIKMLYLAISDSLTTVEEEREDLQKKIAELGKSRETKTSAEVVVITEADRAVTSEFTLGYLVPNARWTPHYDVRVASISQPVDLRYRAKVSQESGEDWTGVRLKLSTGDPSASATVPTLPVWRAYPGSRPPTYNPTAKQAVSFGYKKASGVIMGASGEALIGASVLVVGTSTGTVTDIDGRYSLDIPEGGTELLVSYLGFNSKRIPVGSAGRVVLDESAAQLDEVVVTGYSGRGRREKKDKRSASYASPSQVLDDDMAYAPVPVNTERRATTVVFDIELPYTIPSDGKPRDVEIKQHDLPAAYSYLAVPKFSPDAYLTATVTNWDQYDLLNGEVQLFFEGTYLGTTALDVSSTNDTLELSLGRDAGVLVERKETDEYRKRNFFGGKVTESRGYTIAVRNKKGQPIKLTLLDQVPVSADEGVDVKLDLPAGVRHEEKTGFLEWKLELAPGVERKVQFGYTVKSPKNRRVVLE